MLEDLIKHSARNAVRNRQFMNARGTQLPRGVRQQAYAPQDENIVQSVLGAWGDAKSVTNRIKGMLGMLDSASYYDPRNLR